VDVVRELLDKLVVDRNGREMGRVDGIVLDQREGEPPRLSAVLIGASALGDRLHPTIGRWVAGFQHALGVNQGPPVRIDFSDIGEIAGSVKMNLPVGETAARTVEQRLRAWIARIPGWR
jgi:sporulation protein YlmC with PRC-barrel domain